VLMGSEGDVPVEEHDDSDRGEEIEMADLLVNSAAVDVGLANQRLELAEEARANQIQAREREMCKAKRTVGETEGWTRVGKGKGKAPEDEGQVIMHPSTSSSKQGEEANACSSGADIQVGTRDIGSQEVAPEKEAIVLVERDGKEQTPINISEAKIEEDMDESEATRAMDTIMTWLTLENDEADEGPQKITAPLASQEMSPSSPSGIGEKKVKDGAYSVPAPATMPEENSLKKDEVKEEEVSDLDSGYGEEDSEDS
ncbi:hypothetical protein U1Q18_047697, partial [Sarracenia purpurea var. burkii]